MSHLDPKRPVSKRELRQFGLLVGGAFVVLAAVTLLFQKPPVVIGIFATLGATLILTGLAAPGLLAKVYVGWMGFAVLLSKVTTPIFMGVIYFLVLSPIGALMRAAGRNPLKLRPADTAWVTRPADARRGALERQF